MCPGAGHTAGQRQLTLRVRSTPGEELRDLQLSRSGWRLPVDARDLDPATLLAQKENTARELAHALGETPDGRGGAGGPVCRGGAPATGRAAAAGRDLPSGAGSRRAR